MAFLTKVDETNEEKIEGVQGLLDVHNIKREGLPEEILKVCKVYVDGFPSNLQKNCHPRGWVMNSKLI